MPLLLVVMASSAEGLPELSIKKNRRGIRDGSQIPMTPEKDLDQRYDRARKRVQAAKLYLEKVERQWKEVQDEKEEWRRQRKAKFQQKAEAAKEAKAAKRKAKAKEAKAAEKAKAKEWTVDSDGDVEMSDAVDSK